MKRTICILCALALLIGLFPATVAAAGGMKTQGGHFNAAYIEWEPVAGATGYQVFVKEASAADSTYTRLDEELVREYPTYWRADALGLAAGEYVMKVLAVKDGKATAKLVSDTLTVRNHERTGYAFYNGNIPGAYKMDGTLKDGAKVVYVTDANKSSVTIDGYSYQGLENIITNINKIKAPVCIRIIGRIMDLNSGCVLVIKNSTAQLTIEGVGNDATADGWGFEINTTENMELSNLAIMMVASKEGDGVTLNKAKHTWVHNCDFFYNTARNDDGQGDKEKGDGSLDTKYSTYITHSYNHFWDAGKCNLQGSSIDDTSDWITYHHNWYDHSDSRHPRVRVAHVHVFNNYYDHNDGYGIGAVHHATVFSDRNYFDNCKNPMLISNQGSDKGTFTGNSGTGEAGGMIKAYGNEIKGGTYVPYSENSASFDAYDVSNVTDTVPSSVKSKDGWAYDNFDTNASKFYIYAVDAAADVPTKVRAYAGRVEGGDLEFDMTKLTNAGSKYPDSALLAALEAYTGALVSVGGKGGATVADPEGPSESPTATPSATSQPTSTPSATVKPSPSAMPVSKTYTLDINEVYPASVSKPGWHETNATSGYYDILITAEPWAIDANGVTGFFTIYPRTDTNGNRSRFEKRDASFSDHTGQYNLNLSGQTTVSDGTPTMAIGFQTSAAATVKIWWTSGGTSNVRYAGVLDANGNVVGPTPAPGATPTAPTVTTVKLSAGGTYYVGNIGGTNRIYKVEVTVEETATPTPTQAPSETPSESPSASPSSTPSAAPSASPSVKPSAEPSATPSVKPSASPSPTPTKPSGSGGGGGGGGGSFGGGGGGGSTMPMPTPTAKPSATPIPAPTDKPTSTGLPFVDVAASDWYYATVKQSFERGLMKGTDATHFTPGQSTSRAMIATVLFRLDGEKKANVQAAFDDVASGVWYTDAVAWAAEKGVVKGYSEDVFAPDDDVTREQLAVMLYRYAAPSAAVTGSAKVSDFADAQSVSSWALEAMEWAVKTGIITGKGANNLDPQGLASRAEAVTMLMRYIELQK